MKPISQDVVNIIKKHLLDGLSNRKTAERAKVSRGTVNRIASQLIHDGKTNKGGRPKKLTEREKAFCVRKIRTGGNQNAVEVQKCLKSELDVNVTAQTVRNCMKEAGLCAFKKPNKPYLSKKNIRHRLAWGRAHLDWTIEDWKRVVFSDETKINRFGSDGNMYGWKSRDEALQTRHVRQTVKHGGGNIKLWSCITSQGVGFIVRIEGNLTKEIYLNILKEDLYATMREYKIDPAKMVFQHDNDPKHTAGIVQKWLSTQKFEVLDWPAQSPDLNPIENMWATLKKRLFSNYEGPPNGMIELWERVHHTWYHITKEEVQKYIESMPNRCKEVIKTKGLWTKY